MTPPTSHPFHFPGAGKSTLLELLAGRRRPLEGAVEVYGEDPFLSHPSLVLATAALVCRIALPS